MTSAKAAWQKRKARIPPSLGVCYKPSMSNRAKTAVSEQIAVRMPLDELAELDAFRAANLKPGVASTRAEVVREAVRRLVAPVAPPPSR